MKDYEIDNVLLIKALIEVENRKKETLSLSNFFRSQIQRFFNKEERGNIPGIINSIDIISSQDQAFPFVCPICKLVDVPREYIRIHYLRKEGMKLSFNPMCVHSDCLMEFLTSGVDIRSLMV